MSLRHPAEWELHSACWLAFPRLPEEWPGAFEAACQEWSDLCRAIADVDLATGQMRGEPLHILCFDQAIQALATAYLGDLPVTYHCLPYDDIWLRDTAPVFLQQGEKTVALEFEFNVWGNRFDFPNDRLTAAAIAQSLGVSSKSSALVAEGGALESDGQGTVITTRQCLLNSNRNPSLSQEEVETMLVEAGGYQQVLWLDGQLINDHTDGHVDTLARFVTPGVVMVMLSTDRADANRDRLNSIAEQVAAMEDAQGRSLQLVTIPSPGEVRGADGELLPASYLNFYIGNRVVVIPTYGSPFDREAIAKIATCFPTRQTIGLSAKALITGGGAFHCITQQQP